MRNYQNLEVWKVSMQLIKEIYLLTKAFPKEELFGFTSQIKRASVSVSANIAEGLGRQYKKDTLQFLHISRGSLYELETLMNVAVMVEIINMEQFEKVIKMIDETIRLLSGFITYVEKAALK